MKTDIILYHPENALNVGSVARGMANLGFDTLKIVPGINLDLEGAHITARKADIILKSANSYSSLDASLTGSDFVLGFSTKDSKNTPPIIDLPFLGDLLEKHKPQKLALLFGPESIGLTYEELPYCSALIRIPSSEGYDSLNLAQAAMLAMYEIRRHAIVSDPPDVRRFNAPVISLQILNELIRECAELSNFKTRGTPEKVLQMISNFFRRVPLSPRESRILLGFFSRITKSLKEK